MASSNPKRTVRLQFAVMFLVAVLAGWLASLLPANAVALAKYPDLAAAASPERLLSLRQIAAVSVFALIICAYIIRNEAISIGENLYLSNPDSFPKWIAKRLKVARDGMEQDGDKTE